MILDLGEANGQSRYLISSGVLADIAGHCVYLTAAHCIDEVFDQVPAEHTKVRFLLRPALAPWAIALGYQDLKKVTFPAMAGRLEDPNSGASSRTRGNLPHFTNTDVGFIVLQKETANEIRSFGCLPLQMKHLRFYSEEEVGDAKGRHLETYLFGAPMNSLEPNPTWDTPTYWVKSLRLRLDAIPSGPRIVFTPFWPGSVHKGSIDGMSGGPIAVLGWKTPVVVAFQSSESMETTETSSRPGKSVEPSLLWATDLSWVFGGLEKILGNTEKC